MTTSDTQAREKLITARVGMLMRAPFFGNIATRLELVNADSWCSTAATDGRKFYYNADFINKLPIKQAEFLFGHEILHCCYSHIDRRGVRDALLSNIAQDYVVNADCIQSNLGEKITVVDILYDSKYLGWAWEDVYDDLLKNADEQKIQALGARILDEHLDGSEGQPEELTVEEKAQVKNDIRDAMLQAAQAVGASNLPGNIARLVASLTESVISWQELLEQQIISTFKNDFSWARPSRRGWHMDAILPGMKPGEMVDVVVAIDQSGSISADDSKAFLSEIKGIMEAYTDYKIRVWCFDTDIYNDQEFSTDSIETIESYEPMGGGGTLFEANWDYMKANDIEPKKFIMFTDGVPGNTWGDSEYCDTIWIIKGNPGCRPPFGVFAHYEDNSSKHV